jgi:hypothetical protein
VGLFARRRTCGQQSKWNHPVDDSRNCRRARVVSSIADDFVGCCPGAGVDRRRVCRVVVRGVVVSNTGCYRDGAHRAGSNGCDDGAISHCANVSCRDRGPSFRLPEFVFSVGRCGVSCGNPSFARGYPFSNRLGPWDKCGPDGARRAAIAGGDGWGRGRPGSLKESVLFLFAPEGENDAAAAAVAAVFAEVDALPCAQAE